MSSTKDKKGDGMEGDVWSLAMKAMEDPTPFLAKKSTTAAEDGVEEADVEAPTRVPGIPPPLTTSHTHILVCGAQGSGKSTLVMKLLDKKDASDGPPKPTTALDYTYGRRRDPLTDRLSAVGHLWELGGGLRMASLSQFVIHPATVHESAALVVVDAGDPGAAPSAAIKWIEAVGQAVKKALRDADGGGKGSGARPFAKAESAALSGHEDAASLLPGPGVPCVLVVARYDAFLEKHPEHEKRALFARTMRLVGHAHRCSVVATSTAAEGSVKSLKALAYRYAFRVGLTKKPASVAKPLVDHNRCFVVPLGADSAKTLCPGSTAADLQSRLADLVAECASLFGTGQSASAGGADAGAGAVSSDAAGGGGWNLETEGSERASADYLREFPEEPRVDALRAQMDNELERYRNELRQKERIAEAGRG